MVDFKIVVSDPKTGRSYNTVASGGAAGAFIGKAISSQIDGGAIGLDGYKIEITGGSDRTGIPARKGLPGSARRALLVGGGVGFNPVKRGERRRKTVRGSEITGDFVQVNVKVVEYGATSLDEILGAKEEAKAE
ncbi:MAG: 30S ribosomal protein S6e [Methanocalculus sp. MSAO_Arc1]|uniref:30S ribosomal protein S6e n=1 Tax=Methanocalculus TaxID=71151 RepID=UPI000FF45B0D|nr:MULTISPECIES: 30S ribosomal protein S6e [unclassified Methanocalculus]RQD78942.1 MAG: 30S ribosomal protein S6e [Methanocalculus sp. MSAO_Arc1]